MISFLVLDAIYLNMPGDPVTGIEPIRAVARAISIQPTRSTGYELR